MGILESIPIVGRLIGLADKGLDLADQAVTDQDKLVELKSTLVEIKTEADQVLHLAELNTKTVPWIDGLHKMGRQLLNFYTITMAVVLLLMNVELTPTVALILGGPNAVYQFVKGKGK